MALPWPCISGSVFYHLVLPNDPDEIGWNRFYHPCLTVSHFRTGDSAYEACDAAYSPRPPYLFMCTTGGILPALVRRRLCRCRRNSGAEQRWAELLPFPDYPINPWEYAGEHDPHAGGRIERSCPYLAYASLHLRYPPAEEVTICLIIDFSNIRGHQHPP